MFGQMVVAYLFLGGAGAGACAVLSGLALLVPSKAVCAMRVSPTGKRMVRVLFVSGSYRRFMAPAYALAFGLVTLGALLLVFDLGVSSRMQLLFLLPHATYLTFGSYALVALMLVSLLLASAWGIPMAHWRFGFVRFCQVACLLLGVAVMAYTGLLLSSMATVPLWSNAWLPALFVASSFSCGCAIVLACACLTGTLDVFGATVARMMAIDVVALVAEIALALAVIGVAHSSSYDVAVQGAGLLLTGQYAYLFIGGFGVIGIALPISLEAGSLALDRCSSSFVLTAAAAVLVGGYVLRYCVVAVGAHPAVWTLIS